ADAVLQATSTAWRALPPAACLNRSFETSRSSPPLSGGEAPSFPRSSVGMPSSTLRVVRAAPARGRGASKTAFPRGAWEREKPPTSLGCVSAYAKSTVALSDDSPRIASHKRLPGHAPGTGARPPGFAPSTRVLPSDLAVAMSEAFPLFLEDG